MRVGYAFEKPLEEDRAMTTMLGFCGLDCAHCGAFLATQADDDELRAATASEWSAISQAWTAAYLEIPDGAGWTDESFPAFAPIQILIHPDVWKYDDGTPSFVFARMRTETDFAVVNTP